jgi:hypothetical protein
MEAQVYGTLRRLQRCYAAGSLFAEASMGAKSNMGAVSST